MQSINYICPCPLPVLVSRSLNDCAPGASSQPGINEQGKKVCRCAAHAAGMTACEIVRTVRRIGADGKRESARL